MKQQLIDAWQTNNKMNLLLIDNISDEGMRQTLSTRGGRTVYQQLVHLHNVRMSWLERAAKEIYTKYTPPDKEAPYDRTKLCDAFTDSGNAITELIDKSWDNDGRIKGFKKGLIPLIAYFISHDSHHRGNILLTIKQCGMKIPEILKWGLWEWDK